MSETTNFYFVTYKKLKGDAEEWEYDCIAAQITQNATIEQKTFEHDSKGKLHVHLLVRFNRKNPYLNKYIRKNYSSNFIPIYDEDELKRYLSKEVDNTKYMF